MFRDKFNILIISALVIAGFVYTQIPAKSDVSYAQITLGAVDKRLERTLLPETGSLYDLGTSTRPWRDGYFEQLCLTSDTCRTTWPGGGGGTFPFDKTSWGVSTTTTMGFGSGLISQASTTITGVAHLVGQINASSSATSTFAQGIDIDAGCFAVNGVCIGGGSGTVTASGTPSFKQVTTWYDSSTIEGSNALTFDGRLLSVTASNPSFKFSDTQESQDWYFGHSDTLSGNPFIIHDTSVASSAPQFVITSAGDIGLSVGVPDADINIERTAAEANGLDIWLENLSTATHSNSALYLEGNNAAVGAGFVVDGLGTYADGIGSPATVIDVYTNHPLVFNTNATERMRIDTSGNVNITGLTASQLVATDGSKNLQSLSTATYPSLAELAYVKGLTSSAQTQLDGKLSLANWFATTTHALISSLPALTITESQISDLTHYTDTDVADYVNASTTIPNLICSTGQIMEWSGTAWICAADETGGAPSWGSITGTLSNQTDLQTALDAKLSLSAWFATTTHALISSLPSLTITESQISDLSHYNTFNTDFDTRLAATTTLNNITTLGSLSITESQISDLAHYTSFNTDFDTRLAATTTLNNITTLGSLSITESQISDLTHYTNSDVNTLINASSTLSIPLCSSGEIIEWNGSRWACGADDTGGASGLHADGGGYVFPLDGDYHSAPYYVATSTMGSATSTFAHAVSIGGGTRDNMLALTADRTYVTSLSENGLFNIDNTLNARAAINIYSNVGSEQAEALLEINSINANADAGGLYINMAGTGGADYGIKLDGPTPDIEFDDTSYSGEPTGAFEIDVGDGYGTTTVGRLTMNFRNNADSSFVRGVGLGKSPIWDMGIFGFDHDDVTAAFGFPDPDLITPRLGQLQLGLDNSAAQSTVNEALIDASLSFTSATGGCNATSKYHPGMLGATYDASLTTPKWFAGIFFTCEETFAADTDVASGIEFWTGQDNETNPKLRMKLTEDGDLWVSGDGTATTTISSATSTFATSVQIGSSSGDNAFRLVAGRVHPASDSDGGMMRLVNTLNSGSAFGAYTEHGSGATNDLMYLQVNNSAFDRRPFRLKTNGTGGGALFDCDNTSSSNECVNIASEDTNATALGVSGKSASHGISKITANDDDATAGNGSNANASLISGVIYDAAQGLFFTAGSGTGSSTGKFIQFRNFDNQFMFDVHHDGRLGIWEGSADAMIEVVATTTDNAGIGSLYDYLYLSSTASADGDIFKVDNAGDVSIGNLADAVGTFVAADANGKLIATTSPLSREQIRNQDWGVLSESINLGAAPNATILTSQRAYYALVGLKTGDTASGVCYGATVASASSNHFYVGLYDKSGNNLASSTDLTTTNDGSTGIVCSAFQSAYSVTADGAYYAVVLSDATTPPTIVRGGSASLVVGGSISGGPRMFGTQSSLTSLPSTATIGGTSVLAVWLGVY